MMSEELTKVVTYLGLFGMPSMFTILVAFGALFSKTFKSVRILQRAQKAQMRSQLLRQHDEYMAQGYIEQIYLDDWLNQYKAYHFLEGDNEVLEVKKKDLLELPNKKPNN